ncbi:hypothetical protein AC623_10790 [Bacillus sp. FJAT-27231]|uniref:hypothetical protein n=1 Tax=Bacillus sp. FJAT-27231 TaxID=1679168 RepID=UPI000670F608|nr:hypothetical protein [Bacillus sp. FJAT-27231]KMY54355.1 hypothetical protein AC623_10790 [Bacillus sp. FJAT-27231]
MKIYYFKEREKAGELKFIQDKQQSLRKKELLHLSIYLKFKGSNPKVLEHLRYNIETKQGGLSGSEYTLNKQGEVTPDAEQINKVVTSKTKELTITVDWLEKGKEKLK